MYTSYHKGVCGELGWVRFLVVCFSYKPIPTHEKLFAAGNKWPNATFTYHFLGLGWPWVGGSVGLIAIFICFLTQQNLVNCKHPRSRSTYIRRSVYTWSFEDLYVLPMRGRTKIVIYNGVWGCRRGGSGRAKEKVAKVGRGKWSLKRLFKNRTRYCVVEEGASKRYL